ncbi:hypothetical protein YPPY07_1074, partial [Yersinia pestis PY-07]
MAVTSRV